MPPAQHGVVIGASMGGLLAARALADTHTTVTIVERDILPVEPVGRRGVPQGRQLHVLLARGRQALDELFPGLSAELAELGAPMVDLHDEVHWYNDGHRMRRAASDLVAVGIGRPLLEHVVRRRVAALPGVSLRSGEVLGLTATADRARITGVRIQPFDIDEPAYTVLADLVVDASGRASRTPVWLAELGYRRPVEEQVRVDVTYVTRLYRRAPHHLDGLLGALANAVPGAPRAGIAAAQEHGRVAVVLSGMLGERPPTDDEGMAAFAATLAAPQLAEIIRTATPVSEPAAMRFPRSTRRRYERLRRFPAGYLVIADALCSFNPIYGQGMTVAALQALLLRRLLAQPPRDLPRRFLRAAAGIIDGPWSISVGTDLRFPQVAGRRTAKVRFVNAYVHRLHVAAAADPVLGAAFLRVLNLIDPPTRLLAPGVVLRVLRGALRRRPAPLSGSGDAVVPSAGRDTALAARKP